MIDLTAPPERVEEASILLSLCMLAASGEPLEGVADAAAALLADALDMRAAIYTVAEPRASSTRLARVGQSSGARMPERLAVANDERFVSRAIANSGLTHGRGRDAGILEEDFIVASACRFDGEPVGMVLLAGGAHAAVGSTSSRVLAKVTSLVTHALSHDLMRQDRARVVHELELLASRDPLTGLANRRMLDEQVGLLLARARQDTAPVAVAMLDMDRFKRWNDTHGHAAGDDLLVRTAAAWTTALRVPDLLARYGGEEFALLLPNTGTTAAARVVHRLRGLVPYGQTCSAGLVAWNGHESAKDVLARADAALYEAKRTGRDRAVVA